jgi:Lrp/AsnC family transcriptional regulator
MNSMSEPKILDAIDKRILRIIQKDASLSINEIASRVGLSQTPCWKRLQRLEAAGVIKRRIALLDPMKLGLGISVFVTIEVGDHSAAAQKRFVGALATMEEIMDFYRMAGEVDYLLRVVVPDTAAFDEFYKRLIEIMPLKNVTSRFALETIKSETAFPIAG